MTVLAMEERKEEQAITVNVSDIDAEDGLYLALERPVEDFLHDLDDKGSGRGTPVKIEVNIKIYGQDIYVTGIAGGGIELQCSCCLADYRHRLDLRLDAHFVSKDDAGEEDEINVYDGVTINIHPLVRDNLIMAMPIKPLCRGDCKGLCVKCGADLNVADCGCERGDVDARLAVLRKLKEKF
ncbi:MAG: hypothetical protein IEMM0002_0692 [bacterium]|nr:MAG: hypothetical protein IEMM0002_0692 [bacterium]